MGQSNVPSAHGPGAGVGGEASIEAYVEANYDRYTPEALTAAAVSAGYPASDARRAIDAALARRGSAPRRPSARSVVVVAYLLVYGVLAAGLLGPGSSAAPFGGIAVMILTVFMGFALLISIFLVQADWIGGTAGVVTAFALLLVVGGSCVASTGGLFGFRF